MVSDILTVTAFIVFIAIKLLPVISEIGEGIMSARSLIMRHPISLQPQYPCFG